MVYKLMQSASKRWRLLNGTQVLVEVLQGTIFIDGIAGKSCNTIPASALMSVTSIVVLR